MRSVYKRAAEYPTFWDWILVVIILSDIIQTSIHPNKPHKQNPKPATMQIKNVLIAAFAATATAQDISKLPFCAVRPAPFDDQSLHG